MDRIRVLLVDDAAAVRRLVSAALNRDPDLEVVGTAADGQIALNRLAELRPDVVLLDLEMPVLGGLETLVALRKTHPRLPVIMFSRFTQRGVEATVHALTLGADDYGPKPGDGLDATSCVEGVLIPKIKLLGRRKAAKETGRQGDKERGSQAPGLQPGGFPPSLSPLRRVEVVAVGA